MPHQRTLLAWTMVISILLFSGPGPGLAAAPCPTLDVSDPGARNNINHYLCYYAAAPNNPAHKADSPEALPATLAWQPARGLDLVFSQTNAVYWITLSIRNAGDEPNQWFLELHYPLLDDVRFWQRHNQLTTEKPLLTGDQQPFASRAIDYRYFLLPVTLDPGETREIYLRVHSSGALNVPLSLYSASEIITDSNQLTLIHGLFYGALTILAVFNLLLFASSHTRYYFYNAFYIASMGLFLFIMGGFANQYFWPESTTLAYYSIPVTLMVCALAMTLFGWSFLEVATGTLARKALQSLATIVVGFLALTFLIPYSKSILMNTALMLIVIVTLQVIAFVRWRQGYLPAIWYLAAWGVMVAGAMVYALAAFGYLGDYQAREVMMQAVVGTQVVLLNYALVQRWRLLNQKLFDVEHQARTSLELKVNERTAQLRHAMKELEQANRQLAALSLNDALTGLFNRRHMDNQLSQRCREASRSGKPLTLALLDADHFKRINDTWGHDFGDQCLRQVADTLRTQLKRPRDSAFRFGGEEFALILPDTDTQGALAVCQAILQATRQTPVATPDHQYVSLTLSAGIAQLRRNEDAQAFFKRADAALYDAKHSGRNQVKIWRDGGQSIQSEV